MSLRCYRRHCDNVIEFAHMFATSNRAELRCLFALLRGGLAALAPHKHSSAVLEGSMELGGTAGDAYGSRPQVNRYELRMRKMSETVIPQVKMLITYDVLPGTQDAYTQFVRTELIPVIHKMGLNLYGVWHTAYGAYPSYLATFVAESLETLEAALMSSEWHRLESKLKRYTANYSNRVVRFKTSFQF